MKPLHFIVAPSFDETTWNVTVSKCVGLAFNRHRRPVLVLIVVVEDDEELFGLLLLWICISPSGKKPIVDIPIILPPISSLTVQLPTKHSEHSGVNLTTLDLFFSGFLRDETSYDANHTNLSCAFLSIIALWKHSLDKLGLGLMRPLLSYLVLMMKIVQHLNLPFLIALLPPLALLLGFVPLEKLFLLLLF